MKEKKLSILVQNQGAQSILLIFSEVGEAPLQGALREMEEEAGLVLNPSNSVARLFCLWESVYPPLLPFGSPKSHHVVLYFHVKSKESWEELQAKVKVGFI